MTLILAPDGRPAREAEEQWMVPAMLSWLSSKSVVLALVQANEFTVQQAGALHETLFRHLEARQPVSLGFLREMAYRVLRHRRVRREIVKVWHQHTVEDYERAMDQWMKDVDAWMAGQTETGGALLPKPMLPQKPPTKRDMVRQLQSERMRLEKL